MNPNIIRSATIGVESWFEEGCFVTELCNTPADPALLIARIRVAARTATRWHHLDVDERYLIAEGRGVMEMDGDAADRRGSRRCRCRAGGMCATYPQ